MKTKNILSCMKRNMTRFLLLAVLLTAGLTLRMAAFAKYNAYMDDFTSAVAGDFCFGSDILDEPGQPGGQHTIGGWDAQTAKINVEIRNYLNSLRWNSADVDFFYTVDAAVYTDENCSTKDSSFTVTVDYMDSGEHALTPIESGTKKYMLLPGTEEFNTASGVQKVRIRAAAASPVSGAGGEKATRYLKITAHTLPLSEANALAAEKGLITSGAYDTTRGVYASELEAVYKLVQDFSSDDIISCSYTEEENYIYYRLSCSESYGGTSRVKVCFDPRKLTPADNSAVYWDNTEGKPYVLVIINSGGSEDITFSKIKSTASGTDLKYFLLSDSDIDPTLRDISAVGQGITFRDEEGKVITQAAMGTRVYATVSTDAQHTVSKLNITAAVSPYLSPIVTKLSDGRFMFTMPNSQISVVAVLQARYEVTLVCEDTEHGSAQVTPTLATAGTLVTVTTTPQEGYEAIIQLQPEGQILGEGNQRSFTMPDSDVKVTVVFQEVTE